MSDNIFNSNGLLKDLCFISLYSLFSITDDDLFSNSYLDKVSRTYGLEGSSVQEKFLSLNNKKIEILKSGVLDSLFAGRSKQDVYSACSRFEIDCSALLDKLLECHLKNDIPISCNLIQQHSNSEELSYEIVMRDNLYLGRSYYRQQTETKQFCIARLGCLSPNFDPHNAFKNRFSIDVFNDRNLSVFDEELLMNICSKIPKVVTDYAESAEFKKRCWRTRSGFYAVIAKSGIMNKKIARRLRSEASEGASSAGLEAIINNIGKYPNPAEILCQLADSNYDSICIKLAKNIPAEYLPFMTGASNSEVLKIVAERLDKFRESQTKQ